MLDLLLVAGAGASHKLGVRETKLPLMAHWAGTLCHQLDAEEPGLAEACGLDREFDGEAFEIAIGEVLEWDQVRSLEEKFEPLALNNFNGPPKEKVRLALIHR